MKKLFAPLLALAFLLAPNLAHAGALTQGCFPIVWCPAGQDSYGGACQPELDTVSGAAPSCLSVNGAPDPGKFWAFSCNAGCYQKKVNVPAPPPSCPGGIEVSGECLIKLDILDDDVHATNPAYKVFDGADLTEIVHVDTTGCADNEVAVSDSTSPTGWRCAAQSASSLWTLAANGRDIYYDVPANLERIGLGTDTPTTALDIDVIAGNLLMEAGLDAEADGMISTAIGHLVQADSYGEFVVGTSNTPSGGSPNTWVTSDPVFIVGNGNPFGVTQSNAMTVLKNGRVGIGDDSPSVELNVDGNVRASREADEAEYTEIGHGGSHGFVNTVGDGNLEFRHDGNTSASVRSGASPKLVVSRVSGEPSIMGGHGANWMIVDGNVTNNGDLGLNYYSGGDTIIANGGGNVGIGDTSPSAKLNVVGKVRGSNEAGETNFTEIGHGGSHGYVNTVGAGNLEFRHDGNTFSSVRSGDSPRFVVGRDSGDPSIMGGHGANWMIVDGNVTNDGKLGLNHYSGGDVIIANAGGDVGIGTDAPESKLDVQGDIEMNGNMLMSNFTDSTNIDHLWHDDSLNRWFFNSDTTGKNDRASAGVAARGFYLRDWDSATTGSNDNTYRLLGRDGAWQFYNGGVVVGNYANGTWSDLADGRLIVESRIGVGTTTPDWDIEAQGNNIPTIVVHNPSDSRGGLAGLDNQKVAFFSTSVNDDLVFGRLYDNPMALRDSMRADTTWDPSPFVTFDEKMRLNMGTGQLHIKEGPEGSATNGGLRISDESGGEVLYISGNEMDANGKFHINYNVSHDLSLVDGGGNVGIGDNTPDYKLDVVGTGYFKSSGYAVMGYGDNAGGFFKDDNGNGRAYVGFGNTGVNTYGFGGSFSDIGVYSAGNNYDFYANGPGTNYGSASSKRWKSNIEEIPEALEKVLSLRGVYFDWDEEHGDYRDIGMIAEEVGEIIPEIVTFDEDSEYASGMDYSMLTPVLVEAVKDLAKKVEALEAELCSGDSDSQLCN